MPILQVIVLAVVQGITEFLPISSTAHLYLTSWLLGWPAEALDFDIALHIGTLLAILLYFLRDWLQILAQGLGMRFGRDEELKHNHMMLWLLAIATIPVGVFGYVFNKQAETTWRNPFVMGVMLVAVGVVMWLAERAGRRIQIEDGHPRRGQSQFCRQPPPVRRPAEIEDASALRDSEQPVECPQAPRPEQPEDPFVECVNIHGAAPRIHRRIRAMALRPAPLERPASWAAIQAEVPESPWRQGASAHNSARRAKRIFQAAEANLKFRMKVFFDSPSARLIHRVGTSTAV